MSRFANPDAVGRFVFPGGCQCPGSPHEEDWMDLRTELGTADMLVIAASGTNPLAVVSHLLRGWNLLDEDGSEAPADSEHLGRLFTGELETVNQWLNDNLQLKPLPNGSGAHSVNGSRASASRTRQIQAVV